MSELPKQRDLDPFPRLEKKTQSFVKVAEGERGPLRALGFFMICVHDLYKMHSYLSIIY